MWKTLARGAAIVGATAVLAMVSVTVQTAATADAAPTLPPALVEALQRDLQLTPQEYLDRSADAQAVAAFARELQRAEPGAVGSGWLAPDGTPTVTVATAAAADRVAAAGYRPQLVPFASSTLERSLMNQEWGTGTPPREVQVASGTTPIGGDGYFTTTEPLETAETVSVCSFGFAAADDTGAPLVISAGHCDPRRSAAGTTDASPVYLPDSEGWRLSPLGGTFAEAGVGADAGGLDYAVIALNSTAATTGLTRPVVRAGGGTGELTITGTAVPVVGAPVCKSGQTSRYTCGHVLQAYASMTLVGDDETWPVHGFITSACTLGGDSGGAIVTGTQALGITSGSNVAEFRTCAEASAKEGDNMFSLGMTVGEILTQVNTGSAKCVSLRTATNPTGSCTPDPNPGPEPAPGTGSLGS